MCVHPTIIPLTPRRGYLIVCQSPIVRVIVGMIIPTYVQSELQSLMSHQGPSFHLIIHPLLHMEKKNQCNSSAASLLSLCVNHLLCA